MRSLLALCVAAAAAAAPISVTVSISDQSSKPAAGVHIELRNGPDIAATAETGPDGRADFKDLAPGVYEIAASKAGYETLRKTDLNLSSTTSIELTLVPALAVKQTVNVTAQAAPVEEGASTPVSMAGQEASQLPGRPATVADALPLLPGVARTPGGGLQISGSGEHRSAMIVNSADVTDPATGQFGLTVPIDSVESLNVFQTPFLAEYGRFTAGLVSVETRRGTEKWKWDLNDPFPEFFIRSWHLNGLRDATPRLNFEGPLIAGKLYFSEGFEYEVRKTPVFTLPFPDNLKRKEGFNSFAQLDWIASQKQMVTATVHVAPQRLGYVNMNYYNPQPTAPDAATHNYTATVADHLTVGSGGLFENTFSITRFDARVWGQGTQDLNLTPFGNTGNYFAEQDRNAAREGWSSAYSFAPLNRLGTHNFKAGSYVAHSSDDGQVTERPFNVLDATGLLLERTSFTGGQPFRMHDTEYSFFGQDHWMVTPRLAIDMGLRAESQEVSEALRVAPRVGIAWSPLRDTGTVLRAGFGLFYDHVPLNVYSFSQYPSQVMTTFNPDGSVLAGPILYLNGLGEVTRRAPFVFQETGPGNFSPRSSTWNIQLEQPVTRSLKLRASYMSSLSNGLIILDTMPPAPGSSTGSNLLSGSGQARYRQLELTTRLRLKEGRELFFSYVHSRARGDLNDFANFLGSFPVPIIRPNQFGDLPTDLPNRFLAWGMVQLPWRFRIAPVIEYRNGFPYVATDAAQNYAGVPNSTRFPVFLSVDARVSKDFQVSRKYAVRLSVSGFNLANHFNPEAVHLNTADPAYGLFFGQRGRHLTMDFDVLF